MESFFYNEFDSLNGLKNMCQIPSLYPPVVRLAQGLRREPALPWEKPVNTQHYTENTVIEIQIITLIKQKCQRA